MRAKDSAVTTERLILRPWRDDDATKLQRLFSGPAVVGGRNLPPQRVAKLADASVRQWCRNGFGRHTPVDESDVPVVWYAIARDVWQATQT